MGVARWTFVLGCVWLGHRVITNHVCAQDVCEGGGHTWELVSESFNIPQHFHTYSRVTCKVWSALIKLAVFPIYKPLPCGPGSSTYLAICLQEQKGLLQGEEMLSKSRTLMSQ